MYAINLQAAIVAGIANTAGSGGNARNKSTATEMHSVSTYFDYSNI